MSIESNLSRHWTDEQVIAHLYGVGPEDGHLSSCEHCRQRVSDMQARRTSVQERSGTDMGVSLDFLAAQRRRIYAKLDQPVRWWQVFQSRGWAPAAAMLCVMGAGLIAIEQTHPLGIGQHGQPAVKANVSDAQLAAEVSQFADDSEPNSTAPLQALFED